VIAALGERYRSIAPDIRGHGEAADRVPVTLEAVLADLAGIAPRRFTLVGYSMGGRLALHFAVASPERVKRLVLVGASPGIADRRARHARLAADERLADEIELAAIEDVAERWAATPVLAGQPPAVRAVARADRLQNTPAGLARALRGLGTGALPSLWHRLGELRMPVALVVGERDRKFTAIARRMAAAMPTAQVHVAAGAGHAVHLEAPAVVADAIRGAPGGPHAAARQVGGGGRRPVT
jgi:2-succinyl-6-hydroxy-2,4-cyclohexadiene-1-carboxylate synthase